MAGLHSLATIIKRLETATSRLEDLAVAQGTRVAPFEEEQSQTATAPPVSQPQSDARQSHAPLSASAGSSGSVPSLSAYEDAVIKGFVDLFIQNTRALEGQVLLEQALRLEQMFKESRLVLISSSACSKPDQKTFMDMLAPLFSGLEAITSIKDKNRSSREWFNHLSAVAEGAACVGWVLDPKPASHVSSMKDSAQFYTNRVLKEHKDKNAKHVAWVKSYLAVFDGLKKWILEFYATGLTWNPKGVNVKDFDASKHGTAQTQPSFNGAPPPPPVPAAPAPPPPPPPAAAPATLGGHDAVMASLNKGEAITQGLKKVDKSEMTHKNPSLRAGGSVIAAPATPSKPTKPMKPPSLTRKPSVKPPRMVQESNKWTIEFYENESGLIVEETQMSQVVSIFGCKNTTIQIKGKVNAVTMVNCKKTSVLVESVVSSISVTSSPSFAIQITGNAPTIQLDSTDSGQLYLSKNCQDTEIITAKCSSINVSLPVKGEEEGVFAEQPIPEMLRTAVKGGKLVTTIVEHSG